METPATALEEIRMIFRPKLWEPGRHPGSVEPGVG
jgi:hypothetical protein